MSLPRIGRWVVVLAAVALIAACADRPEPAQGTVRAPISSTSQTSNSTTTTTATSTTTSSTPPSTTSALPAPPPPATAPGAVVVIDPGHNGANGRHPAEINRPVDIGTGTKACDTTGTATNDGYTESAFNLDVALRTRDLLEAAGVTVILTRPDDTGVGPCIDQRARIGNEAHADAAVSIHADGGPSTTQARGFHVIRPESIPGLTDAIAEPSATLATIMRDTLAAEIPIPIATYAGSDGIDVRGDLGGLNLSTVPKVFVECGNMRNANDAAVLTDPNGRQTIAVAVAVAHALLAYLPSAG